MFRIATIIVCAFLTCALCATPIAQNQEQSSVVPVLPKPFPTDGRVTISLPATEMTLGKVEKIPLNLHGHQYHRVTVGWEFVEPGPEGAEIEKPEAVVLRHEPLLGAFVNFIPKRLGKIQITAFVDFADGGVGYDRFVVNVDRLPDRPPMRLILTYTGVNVDWNRKVGTVPLDLISQYNHALLIPSALYGEGGMSPLDPRLLASEQGLSLAVISREGQPSPITLDPATGEVKAIALGQALVKATVRDKSAYACIDVMGDVREFNQRSNCNDFLPAGLKEPIDEPIEMPRPEIPKQ